MNINGVDLNLLVAFEALYRERNVSKAASGIGLAQPSLSNALSRLRHVFKDELFLRSPQGMIPTARAEELAPQIVETLAAVRRIFAGREAFDPARVNREVVIAAADYFELTILPRLIRHLQEHAPGLRIRTKFLENELIAGQLDRGEVDLAFGIVGDLPARIASMPVVEEEFVCLVRTGHALAKKTLGLEAYLSVPQVVFSLRAQARSMVDEELARRGLKREIGLTVSHFISLAFIVKESDMIATLPRRVAEVFSAYLPVRMLPPPIDIPPFHLNLLWSRTMEGDPLNLWLRETVRGLLAMRPG